MLTVEQLGIDVALSAGAAAASDGGGRGGARGSGRGAAPITVDTAGSRWGTESLLLPPGPPAWSVEVAAAAQGAPAGRYEIRIESLPTAPAGGASAGEG